MDNRQRIIDILIERKEPTHVHELERLLGVPMPTIRSVLTRAVRNPKVPIYRPSRSHYAYGHGESYVLAHLYNKVKEILEKEGTINREHFLRENPEVSVAAFTGAITKVRIEYDGMVQRNVIYTLR